MDKVKLLAHPAGGGQHINCASGYLRDVKPAFVRSALREISESTFLFMDQSLKGDKKNPAKI